MFRIDKSDVNSISMNKSYIVIRHKGSLEEVKDVSEKIEPETIQEVNENNIVQKTADDSELILEKARREAGQIKEAAWREGFEQGKAEAEQRGALKVQSQIKEASDFLYKLTVYKKNLFDEVESSVLQLSLEIAKKIINTELKKDDKVYIGIVKRAVSRLNESEPFTLRVSQSEYDTYFKDDANWLQDETGRRLIEVICDPNMDIGDFIVESEQAVIGAGVPLQLNKVERLLYEEIDNGRAG